MENSPLPDFLQNRRSTKLAHMTSPGPDAGQMDALIRMATRVPDHGKLFPWYLVTFEGDRRAEFGAVIRDRHKTLNPDATDAALDAEQKRFLRAPLVVAVISRTRPGKIPGWEQMLSAGALCYNMCLAANALGFGANWLTEWIAFDTVIRARLGCEEGRDHIAGFIYIGTPTGRQDERDRPAPEQIVTRWQDGCAFNKGDAYGKPGMDVPGDVRVTVTT